MNFRMFLLFALSLVLVNACFEDETQSVSVAIPMPDPGDEQHATHPHETADPAPKGPCGCPSTGPTWPTSEEVQARLPEHIQLFDVGPRTHFYFKGPWDLGAFPARTLDTRWMPELGCRLHSSDTPALPEAYAGPQRLVLVHLHPGSELQVILQPNEETDINIYAVVLSPNVDFERLPELRATDAQACITSAWRGPGGGEHIEIEAGEDEHLYVLVGGALHFEADVGEADVHVMVEP